MFLLQLPTMRRACAISISIFFACPNVRNCSLSKKKKNEGAQEGFGEAGVPCLAIHHCFYLGFFSATEEAAIEVPASKVLSCC